MVNYFTIAKYGGVVVSTSLNKSPSSFSKLKPARDAWQMRATPTVDASILCDIEKASFTKIVTWWANFSENVGQFATSPLKLARFSKRNTDLSSDSCLMPSWTGVTLSWRRDDK